jgi:hypothetical protein
MFLARVLGMTLEDLMARMSGYELGLWIAEYRRSRFAAPDLMPDETDPDEFLRGLRG